MIGFINVDIAKEIGVIGKVDIYCDGKEIKRCIEASSDDGYVEFYPEKLTLTNGELDTEVIYGEVKIVIND